jgi:hypothetical protein
MTANGYDSIGLPDAKQKESIEEPYEGCTLVAKIK